MGTKKSKTNQKCDKLVLALIAVILLLSCGLVLCGMNLKMGNDQEYLSVYKHLMYRYPQLTCRESTNGMNYVCAMEKYGVSQDGDPYVSYTIQAYDAATHEPKGDAEHKTLYFQKSNNAIDGYAEALGE